MSLAAFLLAVPAVHAGSMALVHGAPAAGVSAETVDQEAAPSPVAEPASQGAAQRAWERRELELLTRIAALEAELAESQERSFRQSQEWIAYMRVLQGFEFIELPEPPAFIAESLKPKPDPAAEALARQEALRRARSHELGRQLNALLIADGVRGLDLLEMGLVHEHGGRTHMGPVVARLLDGRGRLMGMLRAERLRLEVSRAARVVTLVFEDGFESRGGVKTPFPSSGDPRPGVRRVALPSVDPRPWIEALPELVDRDDVDQDLDDGRWDLVALRVQLTRLLGEASPAGTSRWRLAGLGGVRQRRLMDVQLVEVDGRGAVQRRLFADSAEIILPARGQPEILLRDGSVKRGARVAPFLDGEYRILLPFAKGEAWRAVDIPTTSR